MARTLEQVLNRAANYLYGPYRKEFCTLDVAMLDTGDEATLTDLPVTVGAGPVIFRGVVLNIGTETLIVKSFSTTTNIAQVVRGYLDTEPAAHAEGAFVDISPRFPTGVLWMDLLDEIAGLPQSIYRVVTFEATTTIEERVVALDPLSAGHYGVLGVRATSHLTGEWSRFGTLKYLHRSTSDGDVLVLEKEPASTGGTLEYRVKMGFDVSAATLATTFAQLDMPESMTDVLAMGVALRRLAWAEAQRSDRQAQGEPRIPTESPPMHAAQSANQLRLVYDRRLKEEAAKLWARHGVKF